MMSCRGIHVKDSNGAEAGLVMQNIQYRFPYDRELSSPALTVCTTGGVRKLQ